MKAYIINKVGILAKAVIPYYLLTLLLLVATACSSDDDNTSMVLGGDCNIEYLALDGIEGVVNNTTRSVVVNLPEVYDTKAMTVTDIRLSSGATCNINVGQIMDMGAAKAIRVVNGDVYSDWEVAVRHKKNSFKPKAVFIGTAWTKDDLDLETRTACEWMLDNVPGAYYAAVEDVEEGTCDLSQCKLIWWHWHVDGGVDGHDKFVEKAERMLSIKKQLTAYYEDGGALLLTRYATNLPSFIGATKEDLVPNNCWGGNEMSAELCNQPWTFKKYTGQENHELYSGLTAGDKADEVYCTDKGYYITNSTAQYHIGADWGGYEDYATWETKTGGKILGIGDKAVVVWEYPAKDGRGGIICMGSGCYDWYSYKFDTGYVEKYHKNIAKMTQNAINYLTK